MASRVGKYTFTGETTGPYFVATLTNQPSSSFNIKVTPQNSKNLNEVTALRALNHRNIVPAFDFFQDSQAIYIVHPDMRKNTITLLEFMMQTGLTEKVAAQVVHDIASALLICHTRGICHRDIKLEKIVVDMHVGTAMLTGFEFCTIGGPTVDLPNVDGSIHQSAPEILQGYPYDGYKADVWALGVVFYMMLDREFHACPETSQILQKVSGGHFLMPSGSQKVSPEAMELLQSLLSYHPEQRPTVDDIINHRLFHEFPREARYSPRLTRPITLKSVPHIHSILPDLTSSPVKLPCSTQEEGKVRTVSNECVYSDVLANKFPKLKRAQHDPHMSFIVTVNGVRQQARGPSGKESLVRVPVMLESPNLSILIRRRHSVDESSVIGCFLELNEVQALGRLLPQCPKVEWWGVLPPEQVLPVLANVILRLE